MSAPGPTAEKFFDDQAGAYGGRERGMRGHHRISARRIESGLDGQVLAIGGPWIEAGTGDWRLTVIDASRGMLARWQAAGSTCVQGDALALPFPDAAFDHAVLPLMLHHITERSAAGSRRLVRRALSEAARILRPGGRIWISEFCPPRVVYALELLAAPLTHWALGRLRIPLVIMHSRGFFASTLGELGFAEAQAEAIRPAGAGLFDPIHPVIGLDWLRVPRMLYPVAPTLISATKNR
jgi:SAM-dependent methyltransferase